MASEPTDDYLWAESAAGGDVSDPTAKRSAGYLFEDPWPHEEANFMFRAIGRWIDYFKDISKVYDTPVDAVDDGGITSGDVFLTGGSTRGEDHPGGGASTASPNGRDYIDITHDGEYLIALEAEDAGVTNAQINLLRLSGTAVESNTTIDSGQSDMVVVAANGTYIAVAADSATGHVEVFDYAGNSVYSWTHGAAVYDIAMDSSRVYVVGEAGTSSKEARAWELAGGTLDWELDTAHSPGPLYSAETDGAYVYMAGGFDGSGNNLIQVAAGTGATIDEITLTNDTVASGRIALTPTSVYVATTSSGSDLLTIEEVSRQGAPVLSRESSLTSLGSLDLTGFGAWPAAGNLDADDRYVYVSLDYIYAIPHDRPLADVDLNTCPVIEVVDGVPVGGRAVTTGQWIHSLEFGDPSNIDHRGIGRQPGNWYGRDMADSDNEPQWFRRKFVPGD